MDELGRKLRAARERAGLTIEEISARTKIGATKLKALENGAYDSLPGDFYTRGFLRAYAREVHLPPEDLVREFNAMRAPAQPADPVPQPHAPAPRPSPPLEERVHARRTDPDTIVVNPNAAAGGAVFLALVLVVGLLVWRQTTAPAPPAEPVAAPAAARLDEVPKPAGTAGRETPSAVPEKLVIVITPTADTWVTATADGARTLYRLLKPGEHVKVEASNELSLRVGNAGGFSYSINGKPARPLGKSGEVREVKITRDNAATLKL